jgi:hypothetical protein
MALETAALTLLAFPQQWDADMGTLRLRFLCVPLRGPLTPLAAGVPNFADANLSFEARLIGSLDHVPRSADVVASPSLNLEAPPLQKAALYAELALQIDIDPAAAPGPGAMTPRYRKAVTPSYRAVVGTRELSPHLAEGDVFDCALHEAHDSQPPAPVVLKSSLRWGQVLALALRQPRLAEELGLMGEAVITPDADLFARGGWLYVALRADSDGAGVAGVAVSYAARIPPLAQSRPLFAAVLFPVDKANLVLDDVERDAERYDRGHARMVHGAQVGEDGRPQEATAEDATPADTGDAIRLAWDDEQVAEWLNRQASVDIDAPIGTAGYRVDVRFAGEGGDWQSLQRLRSVEDLRVGPLVIGPYEGEGKIDVVPVRIAPARPAEYWMPRYFAAWRGASLVLADDDLVRLHQRNDLGFDAASADLRLGRNRRFEPTGLEAVPLRYGRDYEFRVRLVDLSCGGPSPNAPLPPQAVPPARDEHYTATIGFRRRKRPGAVEVTQRPTRADPKLVVARPLLGHPDILYTSALRNFAELVTALQADIAAGRERGVGLPDPDVTTLEIVVEVRALDGDGNPWQRLYTAQRDFGVEASLEVDVELQDVATIADFAAPSPGAQALPLPTARDLRLTLRAIGRDDANYFADEAARNGVPVIVQLHAIAAVEADWSAAAPELRSFFFRLQPPDGSVPRPAERLATELGLDHHDLTLAGRAGKRTVFGCSAALRHTLSPECSALTLSSDADATQQWINVLRLSLDRDWSWRGLTPAGITVHRRVQRDGPLGARELVGTLQLPTAIAPNSVAAVEPGNVRAPARQSCELLFFDALDPKPNSHAVPPEFPTELTFSYELTPEFEGGGDPPEPLPIPAITVPVTTPPSQVPQLVSAGIALTTYEAAEDYSSSEPRRRRLWLEFAQPPIDPGDAYFVRVLAVAPDPLLTDEHIPELAAEPPLPLDPEWVRMIDVGQSHDDNGARAMQGLPKRDAPDAVYGLVPLPEGSSEAAPELFGMYTYEIRVGHADGRWCTAQGRYGAPLRVAGVQHPPPPLTCQAARVAEGVLVRAAYATPVHEGRHLRPPQPKTRLWALLYARVRQGDGAAWQNLLLLRTPLAPPAPPPVFAVILVPAQPPVLLGEGGFAIADVHRSLELAGLSDDAPLTVMVVELHREPECEEPVGRELGHAMVLRASALLAVPDAC